MKYPQLRGQFARYVLVGLASNAVLYLAYLALTWAGVSPRVAMTLLYGLGVAQTFFLNKNWSFRYSAAGPGVVARYVASYAAGYAINLAALVFFVDRLGWPHQIVQAVMILALALLLFLLQKFWVFRTAGTPVAVL